MTARNLFFSKLRNPRVWFAAVWLIVSGCFVPPARADYGRVPLFFVEDRDPANEAARYFVKTPEMIGYFDAQKVLATVGQSKFQVTFPGANPAAAPQGIGRLAGRVNFLVGPPSQWKVDLATYSGVAYREIFPGIDLVYSTSGNRLKSEYLVAPTADPSAIRLRYDGGAAPIYVETSGALAVPSASGDFRENAPDIYQEVNGKRTPVEGSFRILPDGTLGFRIGSYDPTRPLIIDPVLSYSTYLGGGGMDAVTSIAVDSAGNAYLAGWTTSTNFPTVNPVRAQNGGGVDAFVAKLNPGGNALVYCTYLGGRGDDRAFGIAVDSSGNAYVTGWTASTAFPTAGAAQFSLAGGRDAFIVKLNSTGSALVYGTFLGGAANDSGNAIAVDGGGNAYVAGDTYSFNLPTLSAFQTSNRGQQNAFAAKLNPFGVLVYSTYLGGNGVDRAAAIAVDGAANAYLTGATASTNFPTAAPLQAASGGNQDAFVTKIGPSGAALIYSTYLGGSGGSAGAMEGGAAIAVDATGAAYLAGATSSTNFPVTAGALQAVNLGGGQDAFVTKLNPAGSTMVYSTYLGGSSVDYATGIAVDFLGNAFVTGRTASFDFMSLRAFQPGNAGSYDAFLTKLNPSGAALVFGTFLGGTASDAANAVAVDALGNAYVTGLTQSSDFPLLGPLQILNGGAYGGFVSKISPGWMAGVFLNGSWYVDRNRNGGFDGAAAGDQIFSFGQAGDIPLAGDWSGSGTLKIGVFRNGQWLLDYNGNGVWDGAAGGDRLYTFGQAGDVPLVGDWTGSSVSRIGVFRGGFWMIDLNGNGQWDDIAGGDNGFWFGNAAYTPVVGDWSGSGATKPGLFINGTWYLDVNGDGQWAPGVDQSAFFGQSGDIPVVGDWSGSGKSNVGVVRNGFWIIDLNGNGLLDGLGVGEIGFWLGNSSYTPVVLR